ncbi:hypothetical protein CDD82_876 [Ophiocordyceps australis]|uniref:Uncharacterized protein n=1 Tax=Ophiocordyceps australis TaxID=1399860 RepID=A0A2C5Y0F5_9HYPO|nr:hypothetical protein CDD82_876 [Ophiocordyceps australis]
METASSSRSFDPWLARHECHADTKHDCHVSRLGDFHELQQQHFLAPFSTSPLDLPHDTSISLLPASYRGKDGDIVPAASESSALACLDKELDLDRLARIQPHLWLAGRPVPPRALHHQLILGRTILVTERMDLHLVWTTGRIFIKPLPRFLLEPCFWHHHLSCGSSSGCPRCGFFDHGANSSLQTTCEHRQRLRKRALGFLFSYTALIVHETDLHMALANHLVPQEMSWQAWKRLVQQLDPEHIYHEIDPRFYHGELRLGRLDKIYMFKESPCSAYMPMWNQYSAFFRTNLAWLGAATVYIVIILTAMQVGLGSDLAKPAFKAVSYCFSIFSILGPLVVFAGILLFFCYFFVNNWFFTTRFYKRRMLAIEASTSPI